MHENRRYVKLRQIWVGLACALLWAPGAKGELVTAAQGPAALTVGRDGLPHVAYADGCALHVAVRENASENTTIVFSHARVAALTLVNGRPEVAANDEVDIADTVDVAALVGDEEGNGAELDGLIEGYTAAADGVRNVLLLTDRGIEWFASPTRPAVQVTLARRRLRTPDRQRTGARTGTVELYRERSDTPRVLVAQAPLGVDGSFAAQDVRPTSPTLYRAVYRDPTTGIPFASLTRTPVGGG